jgi:hypothetical protein
MIPIYIPTRKVTIMAPKIMEKLAFLLNYKGFHTTSITIGEAEIATIQFESFEKVRKGLARWQASPEPQARAMWTWLKEKATIELRLDDVHETEDLSRRNNPYIVMLHFPVMYSEHFAKLFKELNSTI